METNISEAKWNWGSVMQAQVHYCLPGEGSAKG